MRVFQFGYDPSIINVTEGTKVIIHITEVTANLEQDLQSILLL
jgi:hypothetical protein